MNLLKTILTGSGRFYRWIKHGIIALFYRFALRTIFPVGFFNCEFAGLDTEIEAALPLDVLLSSGLDSSITTALARQMNGLVTGRASFLAGMRLFAFLLVLASRLPSGLNSM